jgi:hypothetical protein
LNANARGTRGANDETDIFWVIYISTAYEYRSAFDNDPDGETASSLGITPSGGSDPRIHQELSVVFTETARDIAASNNPLGLSYAEFLARTTVHEVGHQFNLVDPTLMIPNSTPTHRGNGMNIMDMFPASRVPAENYFFHPREISDLRTRWHSPGRGA